MTPLARAHKEKAYKNLEEFLEANPHMRDQQDKINEMLKNTHPDKKLEVLFMMMSIKLSEQVKLLNSLQKLLNNL